jgi:hypothetical protein
MTPMAEHEPAAATFKELERQGWGAKADNYNALAGQITAGAVARCLTQPAFAPARKSSTWPQGRVMSPPAPTRAARMRSE